MFVNNPNKQNCIHPSSELEKNPAQLQFGSSFLMGAKLTSHTEGGTLTDNLCE
jgi:hypothetical protein